MDASFLQEKSSDLKLNLAIPDHRPFKVQEKVAEEDHDLIMALGRQALKERRAAQELLDMKKVMLWSKCRKCRAIQGTEGFPKSKH